MSSVPKGLSEMSNDELDVEQFRRRAAFQRALSELARRDPEKATAVWNSLEEDCAVILSGAWRR